MQTQTTRHIVAAVLIAAAVLGGFFIFSTHRRSAAATEATAAISARIDRMIATASDIAAAQQAYVAPGQPDQPWLERSATLLQQFGQDSAGIRSDLHSAEAAGAMQQIDQGFKAVVTIDQKARQSLQQGQNLLAADLIFSEGRDTVAMLTATLRNLRASEELAAAARRASVERQQWTALAFVLILWIAGIAALTPLPAQQEAAAPQAAASAASPASAELPATQGAVSPGADLIAAAHVSSLLARATNADALRDVLAKLANVLGARGVVIWMGAGEELFPALSFGYDERIVSRMGPIARNAANATAESWRTGQVRTVPSEGSSAGAVAAPVTGVSGCVGVLTAEVLNGREHDAVTCAITAMIASQLSALVSAWPAASETKNEDSGPIAASAT